MEVCARWLIAAVALLEDGGLEAMLVARYTGCDTDGFKAMLGGASLEDCEAMAREKPINTAPVSGRQERLETWISRFG